MSFRRTPRPLTFLLATWALALIAASACGPAIPSKPTWEADIEPLFAAHCNRCHSASGQLAAKAFVDTSQQSDAETPAKATLINKAVHGTYGNVPLMPPPPAQKLADWQIELIENWTKAVLSQ